MFKLFDLELGELYRINREAYDNARARDYRNLIVTFGLAACAEMTGINPWYMLGITLLIAANLIIDPQGNNNAANHHWP